MALTTKRIIALPSQTDPQEGDYLAIDNATSGTHKIPVGRIGVEVDDTLTEAGKAADAKAVGDALDEIRSQVEVTGTASGAIATFTDGAEMPAKSVVVNITPKQSGTGTPSPDNVRQISGRSSVDVWDDPKYGGTVAWNQLVQNGNFADGTTNWGGQYCSVNANGGVLTATVTSESTAGRIEQERTLIAGHKYLFKETIKASVSTRVSFAYRYIGGVKYAPGLDASADNWAEASIVFNAESQGSQGMLYLYYNSYNAIAVGSTIQYKNIALFDLTAMFGSTIADYIYSLEQSQAGAGVAWFKKLFPKDYYEYNTGEETCVSAVNGDAYIHNTKDLGQTVYGGTLDVVTGVLTAYPFYPSYNGETLDGRWICDRAVYAEGATPPTGSQVALISGTGTTYQLTPTEIQTLLGENNVWADSGDVEVVYVRDLNIAINNLLNSNGTRSLGMMAMSAPTEATAEEPAEDDMR